MRPRWTASAVPQLPAPRIDIRRILTWGSAPHPGSRACGGPHAPRRALACAPSSAGADRLRDHLPIFRSAPVQTRTRFERWRKIIKPAALTADAMIGVGEWRPKASVGSAADATTDPTDTYRVS